VLNDVDQSLRSLIEAVVANTAAGDGQASVAFAPPTPDWADAQNGPVVNLFLYDIREDLDGQSSDEVDIRDDDGKVIGRLPPPRKYQLSYLASAWCGDAEAEHELLGAILATVPDDPGIPAEHLTGRLADQGLPVRIKVATPVAGANTWDLWSALGTPPRTAVDIVVTAPLVPGLRTDLAPPAVKFELGVTKEPPGAIGAEGEAGEAAPEPPAKADETAEPKPAKGSKGGRTGKNTTDEDSPGPELEARPGKRWTTFRVREQAVPAPSSD
jgi:Pvc16 N-terminal domain